jgi:hypothetical protein
MLAENLLDINCPAPPPENRAFYDRDPRSCRLRAGCLAVVHAWDLLLHDRLVARDPQMQTALVRKNAQVGIWFEQHGVTPDMHQQEAKKGFTDDPVTRAEYIAGQVLPYTELEPGTDSMALEVYGGLRSLLQALPSQRDDKVIKAFTEALQGYRTIHNLMGLCFEAFDAEPNWVTSAEKSDAEQLNTLMRQTSGQVAIPSKLIPHIGLKTLTRIPCIVEFLELESLTQSERPN